MVLGKNSRTDGRRSPYCSMTTVALFVALCLIGVWFLTSTTIVPVDLAATGTTSDVKRGVSQNDNSAVNYGSGNVVEEKQKETSISDPQSEKSQEETNEKPEEIPVAETEERKDEADVANQGQSDSEGKKDDAKDNVIPEKPLDLEPKENVDENLQTVGNDSGGDITQDKKDQAEVEPKVEETESKEAEHDDRETKNEEEGSNEMLVDPAQAELLNETRAINGSWVTQAMESKKEKQTKNQSDVKLAEYNWKLCNASTGHDYIPCLDNTKAKIRNTGHYEHRERHCPEEGPICLVSCPEGYKKPIKWPESRNKIWYANVPHTKLAAVKGHQNWVKVTGEYLTFPGGGTQFVHGALHYIDFIQENFPDVAWGKKTRVVLDVGCGVASFGGFLFERDVITMSFAPKDEHEAQVQFALERGIPAILAVMGTKRLPFPSRVFDVVHCARCRVPWHIEGGMLLLELNRMLRPGGYFVWSATPVYRNNPVDNGIWKEMKELTNSMCWEMVSKIKDSVNNIGIAIFKKPSSNECYENRKVNKPPLCKDSDDPNASWNVLLEACMHKAPIDPLVRGSQWPELWPKRLETPPYWLNSSQIGLYGQPLPVEFKVDYNHWKRVVSKSYLAGLGINWSNVRNVMDMRAIYGGFAAALKDINVWVLNVVPIDSADTLPIIYERGLFGIYHDWCESFSTYPRTYDLLHADHLFSLVKSRCKLLSVMAEVDRILRPEGKIVVRDDIETISEVEQIARSLHWEIHMTYSKEKEGLISMQKTIWHPEEVEAVMY